MATGADLYMTKLREAEQRQREKEATDKRRAQQAIERGIAPATETEKIVKYGMGTPAPTPQVKPTQPVIRQADVQKVQEATAQGAWSPWMQQPLNLPTELKSYSKGNEVDIVGFLRDAQNDIQAVNILNQAGFAQSDINDAKQRIIYENVLADYRDNRGRYNLKDALQRSLEATTNKKELEVVDAVKGLFPPAVYERFERLRQIMKYEKPLWAEGPWSRAYQEVTEGAPWIFGAVSATKGTPIPHDDIITYLALAGIVGVTAAATAINNKDVKVDNMAMVEMLGDSIKSVAFIKPETLKANQIEVIIPPRNVIRQLEGIPQHKIKESEAITPPKVKVDWEQVTGQKQPTVIWIDPKVTPRDIGITGLVQAQVAVKEAENKVADIAQKTEIPQVFIDAFERNAAHLRKGSNYRDWFMQPKITPKMHRQFRDAYANNVGFRVVFNDYLNRLKELNDAKRVYVETINPEPIKGKLSKEAIEAIAGARLLYDLDVDVKPKTAAQLRQALLYAQSTLLQNAVNIYEQTLSETESVTKAEQAVKTYVKQQVKTLTKPAVKTKTQTKTKTRTKELTRTAENALTRALTAATVATAMATASTARTRAKPFKLPKLKDADDDSKKRQAIKESLGAVTYKRGELKDGGVYHTFYVDKGGTVKRVVTVGKRPDGAVDATGKGSATATLKRVGGKRIPNFRFTEDTGASDTIISASGGKLTITFTGNIISENKGRISSFMPRISGGKGRITPRMPKLR